MTTLDANQYDNDIDRIRSTVATLRNIIKQVELARDDSSYKIEICPDYTNVRVFDFAKQPGSDHFLALSLCPNSIPADMQVTAHSLPIVDDRAVGGGGGGTWFQASGPLRNHIATFQLCLDQMEAFYENMHTIDELCFVVHPLAVSTKCVQRTFKIESNLFVKIIVDPFAPSSLEILIAGPSYSIGKFRQLYDERIRDWDPALDIHKNLLRVFDMTQFPMRTHQQNEADEPHCGICLDYRSPGLGQIPIVSCDNERCALVYHPACLRQWFETLPDSRTCLDVTFGSCPYCKEKWSTSFVSLLGDD